MIHEILKTNVGSAEPSSEIARPTRRTDGQLAGRTTDVSAMEYVGLEWPQASLADMVK